MTFGQFNNINIHYRWIDLGKPDTFVFINALGTDFRIWDDVVEQLSAHGNVLNFDKRGHGLTSIGGGEKLEDYMQDLIALVESLQIKRFHLIGISVGGMIAQLTAFHYPQLIDKLFLLHTRHKIGDANGWNARIKQVEEGGVSSVSEAVLQRWFSEKYRMSQPPVVEGVRTMLNRCSTSGYVATCRAIRDADLTETSRKIKHSTLIFSGTEDRSVPANEAKDLHDLIPNSRFQILEGSGHLPCIDNPKKLCDSIIAFTQGH